jgi:hypothetical protein
MSFEGFLRLHQAGIFSVVVAVILIRLIAGFLASKVHPEEPELSGVIRLAGRYLIVAVLVLSAIGLAYSAMSNQTPRAVIDRTQIDRQQDQHERDVQQKQREAEASKKEKN